jgi:N-methylhydantoinase A
VQFFVEARYPHQIWELDLPLHTSRFRTDNDVQVLSTDFHDLHNDVFAISDPSSPVELISWRARAICHSQRLNSRSFRADVLDENHQSRTVYFAGAGWIDTSVPHFHSVAVGEIVAGPAVIDSPMTNVVLDPGASATRTKSGSLVIYPNGAVAVDHGRTVEEL